MIRRGQLGLPFPLPFPLEKRLDTVVVGAGISGLVHAHALGPAARVVVLEAAARPGGMLWTADEGGASHELGPETLQTGQAAVEALLEELGLEARRAPHAVERRWIVHRGRLVPLPASPPQVLATPLLSWRAKLRLLGEPWRAREDALDGSLADFVRHRLGPEPLAAFVDPLVSGVYAGDPETLSLEAAFPRLRELVRERGSLWAGLRAQRAPGRERRGVLSFPAGLGTLARALAERLGPRLRLATRVQRIARALDHWIVETDERSYEATNVVVATSGRAARDLLAASAPAVAAALATAAYESLAVVVTRWKRDQIDHPLDGFGYLAPSRERLGHLGTLFSSTLRPECCPPNEVLLRTFLGGAREPRVLDVADIELVARTSAELAPLLGTHGGPLWTGVIRWPHALPRYDRGHPRRVRAVEAALAQTPGLRLLGNYLRGIGLPHLIESARALAVEAAGAQR